MAKNERITEQIVRERLRGLEYYDAENDVQVEEQKSHIDAVKRLLRSASKSGKGGGGSPEFIISSPTTSDFLIVIECKAVVSDHSSNRIDDMLNGLPLNETDIDKAKRLQRFAVDGALHYGQALSRDFNVIVVSVSGEVASGARISTHLWTKGRGGPRF